MCITICSVDCQCNQIFTARPPSCSLNEVVYGVDGGMVVQK